MADNLRAIITVQKAQVVSHNVKSEAVTSYQRAEAIAYRNDFSINQWFFYDNFSNSWNGYCSILDGNGDKILNQATCEIAEGAWTPSRLPVSGGGGEGEDPGGGEDAPTSGGGAGGSWGDYEVNPGLTLCSVYDENGDPLVGQVECTAQGGEWRAGFCSTLDENGDIITDENACISVGGGTWYPEKISVPLDDILFWSLSKNLTESFPVTELYSSAYTKPIPTETLSLIETFAKVITYNYIFTDAFTLDDAAQIDKDYYGNKGNVAFILDILGLSISKVATESLPITELYSSAYTKPIPTDSYTVGDIYYAAVNKVVSENLSLLESQVKGINLGKTDSFSIPETINLSTSLVKSDSYSFSDTYYATLNKIVTDSMTITEFIGIGTDIPITESFLISDSIISEINKVIADAFTLDDSTLIDKDYYGNKGNICTVSDVIALAITWVRSYSDSISTGDSANIANISGKVLNGASFNRITLN
jgi:hypothetical protein